VPKSNAQFHHALLLLLGVGVFQDNILAPVATLLQRGTTAPFHFTPVLSILVRVADWTTEATFVTVEGPIVSHVGHFVDVETQPCSAEIAREIKRSLRCRFWRNITKLNDTHP